jgi:hypothetical protein
MNQKELFEEWKDICFSLSQLNVYIQNDFDLSFKDDYICKKDIEDSILEFNKLYSSNTRKLERVKNKMIDLMESKIK